ncbi:MAG: RHS repeat protein, partial [Deltaproteobacteria bacterium]|nr:RHS repeat protein [Deltaproteobacteria bacterium]
MGAEDLVKYSAKTTKYGAKMGKQAYEESQEEPVEQAEEEVLYKQTSRGRRRVKPQRPKQDSAAERTIKTVILGDFYEDPTLFGLACRAGVSMLPVVDQIADVQDIAAWVCLARKHGMGHPDVMFNGLFTGIGCIPTVGSFTKGIYKTLWTPGAAKGVADLLKRLHYLGLGEGGVRILRTMAANTVAYGDQAAGLVKGTLNKLKQMILDLKEFVPKSMIATLDDWHRSVQELVDNVDRMFHEAATETKKKLDDMLARFDKDNVELDKLQKTDGASKSTLKKVREAEPPPAGHGLEVPETKGRGMSTAERAAARAKVSKAEIKVTRNVDRGTMIEYEMVGENGEVLGRAKTVVGKRPKGGIVGPDTGPFDLPEGGKVGKISIFMEDGAKGGGGATRFMGEFQEKGVFKDVDFIYEHVVQDNAAIFDNMVNAKRAAKPGMAMNDAVMEVADEYPTGKLWKRAGYKVDEVHYTPGGEPELRILPPSKHTADVAENVVGAKPFTPSQLKEGTDGLDGVTYAELKKQGANLKAPTKVSKEIPSAADLKAGQKLDAASPDVKYHPATRTKKMGDGDAIVDGPKGASRANCDDMSTTGHPVDVVSGALLTEAIDIELPGPLPFSLKRTYITLTAHVAGPLGHGWSHSLDSLLWEDEYATIVQWIDGRYLYFDLLQEGESSTNRGAKLELTRHIDYYTIKDARGLTYAYADVEGNMMLLGIVDENDNRIQLDYDDGLLLARVIDSTGRVLLFEHDLQGQLESIAIIPRGQADEKTESPAQEPTLLVGYQYTQGDLVAVVDATGNATKYRYTKHMLVSETNRVGHTFYFEFDVLGSAGRCIKTWGDDDALYRELEYDKIAGITRVKDTRGEITTYHHSAVGLVAKEVNPLGNETRYEYDEDGMLLLREDALGHITRYHYDGAGRLGIITNAAGHTRKLYYDDAWRLTELVDEAGNTWSRQYDARGNIIATTAPDGATWRFQVDRRGLPVVTTDPMGSAEKYEWDARGNLVCQVDAMGAETRLVYDAFDRMVERIDAQGGVTRLSYDQLNHLVARQDSAGRVSRFGYDGEHNLVMAQWPDGKKQHFGYGPINTLAWQKKPGGGRIRYRYDKELELVGVKDPAGNMWSFELDACGRVVGETSIDGRSLSYELDAVGQMVAMVDARGNRTAIERDALGRPAGRTYADGSSERFEYDTLGRLTLAQNPSATVKFRYDEAGNVVEEELGGQVTSHHYDSSGHRLKRSSALGHTFDFQYDAAGRLAGVHEGTTTLAKMNYDALGREVLRHLPGGVVTEKTYLRTGEPRLSQTKRDGQVLSGRGYSYDAAGRTTRIDDDMFGAVSFEHDVDGWLKAAMYPEQQTEQFLLDKAGNPPAAPQLSTEGNRTVKLEDWTLLWDADGNLLEKRGKELHYTFEYDGAGRLSQVVRDVRVAASKHTNRREVDPAQRALTSFAYDALGRRVRKVERHRDGARDTSFLWDGDRVLGERWIDGKAGKVEGSVEYLFARRFEPLAVVADSTSWFFECDVRDAPRAAFDSAGQLVWSADFDPYGQRMDLTGPDAVPWRMAGQYADSATGLYYNRFRYYDADLRLYTQSDPSGIFGGLSPHAYVPDPLAFVDPYGLN